MKYQLRDCQIGIKTKPALYYIQTDVKQSDKEKLKIKKWTRDTRQKQRKGKQKQHID